MKLSPTPATCLLFLASAFGFSAPAAEVSYFQEQARLIRSPQASSVLGVELFGDKVNLYNGGLEFIQTDVALPGNNALPVMVGRRLVTGAEVIPNRQFGSWDLEIPHLHGTYTAWKGWAIPFPPAGFTEASRCSKFGPPPSVPGSGAGEPSNFTPDEYWHGHQLYIPGQGDQQLLLRNPGYTDGPKDGQAYPVVTQQLWALRCLSTLANDTSASRTMGEGFIALSPDGTQYRFDWLATRTAAALYKPGGTALAAQGDEDPAVAEAFPTGLLPRVEVWIMPTLVTDRFGNSVRYT